IAEALLKNGANVDTKEIYSDCTPLAYAVKNNQAAIIQLLIQYEANINAKDSSGLTPLFWAIINNNLDIVKLLLQHKADISSICWGNEKLGINAADKPLHVAIKFGQTDIVELLIQYGAKINEN